MQMQPEKTGQKTLQRLKTYLASTSGVNQATILKLAKALIYKTFDF